MKKKGLLLLLAFSVFLITLADNEKSDKNEKTTMSLEFRKRGDRTKRPRMPEKSNIVAFYQFNEVSVEFLNSEGTASIEIQNPTIGIAFVEEYDTEMPISIYIEEETGTYQIDIITEQNHYVGYLTF